MSDHVVQDEELRAFCSLAGVKVSIDQSHQSYKVTKRLISGTLLYISLDYSATLDAWKRAISLLVEEVEARNEGLRQ